MSLALLITEVRGLLSVIKNYYWRMIVQNLNFCVLIFEITGSFVHGKEILFEIAKSSRKRCSKTGLISVPYCMGKRAEIGFV